ncbi:MAG TPA: ATP-binding protein [Azospirillaceae bacterium]|nr:ATP-binding protein [Azospirillaceae bacterium]
MAHVRVETANTARLLAEHALGALETADHVLHRIEDQVREVGMETLGRSAAQWRRFKALEEELPQGGTVWVYDAEGRTVASSARFPAPSVSAADRDYFRAHRDQNLPLAIGPAIRGRTTGRLVFTLSRRLDGADGRFLGALVVALDVGHFTEFFDSLQPSPGVLFALLREDGTPLARLGLSDADLERPPAGSELLRQLSADPTGFFEGSGPFDDERRFFAHRHLEGYPLVVVAGLSREDALSAAWRHAVDTAILVVAALLPLGGLTTVALRGMRREAETRSALEEALRATEAKIRLATERAETASRTKSDFLAIMSHELRTPMNAIIGAVDTLRETTLVPDQEASVALLASASDDLLAQINQLLDLPAIDNGVTLEHAPFDPAQLVRQTGGLFAPQAGKKGLAFDCVIAADLPSLLVGDAVRLRQALVNLIGNAVKFTKTGGVTVTAERLHTTGGAVRGSLATVRITVADTGIGIAPEMRERVFERFTQADSSITRRYGGAGLGLNIARHLVELMGGVIRVSSRPGAGSILTITLALPVAGDQTAPLAPAPLPPAGEGGWRILLVEDTEYNRVVVQTYLKPLHCRIDEAEDGERAVAIFKDGFYDLVLMDVQMPVVDGYAATRAIRAWERQQGRAPTPILALTTHAYASDVEAALAAGCDAHLAKPVRRADLIATVCRLAGRVPARAG